jgi:putative transferase (TIGR04331 family)
LVKRFLITTALEDTWRQDVPVLFLGEWCRRYDRREKWQSLDAEVAPYHWDDRQKLHLDYLFLQKLYEEILAELKGQLNTLHGVEHSLRYWRILIGPWLGYFIPILFDRWTMLGRAVNDYEISEVRILSGTRDGLVSNDMDSFESMYVTDEFSESICGELLEWMRFPVVHLSGRSADSLSINPSSYQNIGYKRRLKSALSRAANILSGMVRSDREYFFISSYLPIEQDLLLQWKLGQLPKLWRSVKVPEFTPDHAVREQHANSTGGANDFPTIARAMIQRYIPTAYREGYLGLMELVQKLPWPKRPQAIFTSNSFSSDDLFKAWAADKVNTGIPLLIGQHGGNYGMSRWSFGEDHQIAIADQYLTWGWMQADQEKVIPFGNLKDIGKIQATDPNGGALLVEMCLPRTSYAMYSVPVASQWLNYFEDQCRFIQALPPNLRKQLLVRLHSHDYGWCQKQRWQERFPSILLEDGLQSMESLISKSRIYISSYNSSTYLQSLSLNIPTIIFWNPEHWELRDSAIHIFEKLKSVGIFHDTPEGAARQMAQVWDDVGNWWQSESTERVRREFCQIYAHIPERPLDLLEQIFRRVVAVRH